MNNSTELGRRRSAHGRRVAALLLTPFAAAAISLTNSATANGAGATTTVPTSVDSQQTASQPEVWFGPLAPLPPGSQLPFRDGSVDYLDLWAPEAPWPTTGDRVQVFSMYATYIEHYGVSDDELRTIIEGVERNGMALSLEVGPLPDDPDCGGGEGFGGVYSLDRVRRIQQLGGKVDIIVLDEPWAFGHVSDAPNACHYSTEEVADKVADYVRMVREVEPDVVVGDSEPIWTDISAGELAAWLDAYRAAAGEPLAFLHFDADWARRDWPEEMLAAEQAARARGVRVGVYYNGGDAESDEAWAALTMQRAYIYEQVHGGRPDDVLFWSWFEHPDHLLPETDPTTFTGVINRYFGTRTAVELGPTQSIGDGLGGRGTLTGVDGAPVSGPLTVEFFPLDGQAQVLGLEGVVPAGATSALIAFRVNIEGAGPGNADLRVYEVAYSENGSTNLVTNPRFSQGLDGWGSYGSGSATVVASDRGPGQMLRLEANRSQSLSIDSTPTFAVTPGAPYRFSIEAGIPDRSAGTAYAAVIFMAGSETGRQIVLLDPAVLASASVTANASGEFEFTQHGLEPGRYRLHAVYVGDLYHWPAESEKTTKVQRLVT